MKVKKYTQVQRIAIAEKVITQLFLTLTEQQKMLVELANFMGYDLQKGKPKKDDSLVEVDNNQTNLLDEIEEVEK